MANPEVTGRGATEPTRAATALPARWALPLAVLVVGMFMSVLDVTIVNVAIPAIQKDFGGALDDVLWIATAYTLTLGVVVPVSSWLGDRFGLRTVYLLSLLSFAAGSALCGVAWDLDSLIAFRILQAIPGGILPVVTLTMVYRIVPGAKIGAAMGMYGLGIVVAPAVGPVLGGYLVEYLDWRLVFYINVPIGLLGTAAASIVIPKVTRGTARRFDLAGFASIAFGLFAILLAASEGQSWGWSSYRILMLLTAGVLSLALFVVIELEVEFPLLDVRVFTIWPFTLSLLLGSILFISLLAVAFYVPVFLQQGQGKQAFDAGLLILPQALVMGAMMPLAGRLYDKIGARWLATVGLALCGYGTYLMCGITPDMTRGDIIFWTCVRAAGLGLSMMPIMTAGLAAVPPSLTNQASGLNNVARQVTGALGLAALGALGITQQAELFAARAALVRPDPAIAAHSGALDAHGFAAAYLRYQHLSLEVLATSYSNLFLLIAILTAAGAVLGLLLRPGPTAVATDRPVATPAARVSPSTNGHRAPVTAVHR
ncbi:MAG TPA: DHA2 family efflux MFS transporter permease subunit [Pseudonocardia sp.]